MLVKYHLEELFQDVDWGLNECIYGTNHFLCLMHCSKGSTCVLTLQT